MSCGYIPSCAPSCLPSCGSPCGSPVGALGSLSSCSGLGSGGVTTASSLGIASGANVSCVGQMPPSEIMIQQAPVTVVLPGAILSSSSEPVRVGGYTAYGGGSSLAYGRLGGLGRRL